MPATTSPTTAMSTRSSARWATSTPCWTRRTAAASASSSTSFPTTRPISTSGSRRRWQQAPAAAERARYLFRDGKGKHGELPPNNWESVFGGPAWTRVIEADGTPGQWYLHLFDSTQPDFDWSNEEVREEFRRVLRFWLDRGVDGFRVDVAHGLIKAAGLPDYTPPADADSMGGEEPDVPYWGQPGVHEVYRDWHRILDEYAGDRALCAEAWRPNADDTALWVRPDEMHQAFNFPYLQTEWDAAELRTVITESLRGVLGRRRTQHVGALEPRRRSPRVASRADRGEPARTRHRSGVRRQADPRGRPASRPRGISRDARPARLRVHLPGRGARPARGRRPARRGAPGPDLVPHRSASATAATAAGFRFRGRRQLRRTGSARPASPGCRSRRSGPRSPATRSSAIPPRRSRSTARCSRRVASTRSERGRSSGSRASRPGVLAFRNGNVTVVANIGSAPIAASAAVT